MNGKELLSIGFNDLSSFQCIFTCFANADLRWRPRRAGIRKEILWKKTICIVSIWNNPPNYDRLSYILRKHNFKAHYWANWHAKMDGFVSLQSSSGVLKIPVTQTRNDTQSHAEICSTIIYRSLLCFQTRRWKNQQNMWTDRNTLGVRECCISGGTEISWGVRFWLIFSATNDSGPEKYCLIGARSPREMRTVWIHEELFSHCDLLRSSSVFPFLRH